MIMFGDNVWAETSLSGGEYPKDCVNLQTDVR